MILSSEQINFFLKKPIAIFGAGVSGQGAKALIEKLGAKAVIYDKNPKLDYFKIFDNKKCSLHNLCVYSPSFFEENPWIKTAKKNNLFLLNESDFASLFWKGKIIAVSGTNGKTTLTEFLTKTLNSININAFSCGNIGYSLSELASSKNNKKDSYAIFETSSFQAKTLKNAKINAFVWTNFDEDHLEIHPDMKDYFLSKLNISNCLVENNFIAGQSVFKWAKILNISLPAFAKKQSNDFPATSDKSPFFNYPQRYNFNLAIELFEKLNLPINALYKCAETFSVLPCRCQVFEKFDNITFIDDSKATNFHASLENIKNLNTKEIYWIGGGLSKGGDLANFCKELSKYIKEAFLIGSVAKDLQSHLIKNGLKDTQIFNSMQDAVNASFEKAKKNSPCTLILSPGFASFDMFKSYLDRGNSFKNAIFTLKNSKK